MIRGVSVVLVAALGLSAHATSLDEAQSLIDDRRFYDAVRMLSNLIDDDELSASDLAQTHYLRGFAQQARLRVREAHADLSAAVALDPSNEPARMWLATAEWQGWSGERALDSARTRLDSLPESGQALFELAMLTFARGRAHADQAVAYLVKSANNRHTRAASTLAQMHRYGQMVERDPARVAHFAEICAAAGDPQCQFLLFSALHYGVGIPKDASRASQWLDRSLSAGHSEAQFHVGYDHYARGEYDKANYLYWQSAHGGHAPAQINLAVRT